MALCRSAPLPFEELRYLGGGIALRALGLIDGLLQGLEEFAAIGGARWGGANVGGQNANRKESNYSWLSLSFISL